MYSQIGSSSSYFDRVGGRSQAKRPHTTYYEGISANQKPSMSKSLRWNIEEYKENYGQQKKIPLSSSFSTFDHNQTSSYCNGNSNVKRGWELTVPTTTPEIKKSPSSKSYKCIKFSNQFEHEYEKEKAGNKKVTEYLKNRQNMKNLTMSLGYKSSLTDLMGSSIYNKIERPYKLQEKIKTEEGQLRKMKSSKSQRKIKYEYQEDQGSKATFNKSNYVLECSSKSSKKIMDPKLQEKSTPFFNKSCKFIKQDIVRPKMDKTTSYNEHIQHQNLQKLYGKKHHTYESSKTFHQIDISPPSKHTQTSNMSKPPRISIQDFQLGKCKGEGAFGQVFPAVHKSTKMLVAIKKVPKEKVKYMLEQFINEIKIQMYLDHPNIVKLYGFFDDATHFYIIMEYMEGGNLFALIKKKKKLTQSETVQKLKQICIGLKQMHDNSILHRDIKPQNIVMTNDVSKLCDFGWAAICKDRRTTYCGTLDYVSPEIIQGQGYDDSVDVWCIGVLAYQMLCGKTPFYNISRKQTMKKIRDVHFEYPSDLSSLAKDFIENILKKNPDDRMGIDQVLKGKFLNH